MRARLVGYLTCGLALLWSLPHFLAAARIPGFGVTAKAIRDQASGSGFDIIEIAAGCTGLGAGLLALALVQSWGQIFPRRVLTVPAWGGAVVAGGYGYAGLIFQALSDSGAITPAKGHAAVASGWWWYWYVLFAALGTALGATTWLRRARGARPASGLPSNHADLECQEPETTANSGGHRNTAACHTAAQAKEEKNVTNAADPPIHK